MSQMTAQGFRGSILVRIGVMTAILAVAAVPAWAGLAGFNNNRAVGGIVVDADGVVRQATPVDHDNYLRFLREETSEGRPELNDPVAMRKVSLRGLEAAIAQAVEAGEELPDSVRYLAGLQRIQYVFVYPEQNDIVMAGPGEGWKVGDDGSIVGVTTGRPVLLLDDLIGGAANRAGRADRGYLRLDRSDQGRPTAISSVDLPATQFHSPGRRTDRQGDGAPGGHLHGDPHEQPFRPDPGGGGLPDEATGDEAGSISRAGVAQLSGPA